MDRKTKLCGSINTKFLKVIYELRCYVKHSGLLEKGQGNCVAFPIILVEKPHTAVTQRISEVQSKFVSYDATKMLVPSEIRADKMYFDYDW